MEPANALAIAQLIETIASDSRNGKQSAGQCKNVQVSAFELQDKKFVEIMFHQGDASAGESGCRLWLEQYEAERSKMQGPLYDYKDSHDLFAKINTFKHVTFREWRKPVSSWTRSSAPTKS